MLSIDPRIQRWQERELSAWQESFKNFIFDAGGFGMIAVCALILAGMTTGFIEVHAFGARPFAGFCLIVAGIAGVVVMLFLAAFGEIAEDVYCSRTVYL